MDQEQLKLNKLVEQENDQEKKKKKIKKYKQKHQSKEKSIDGKKKIKLQDDIIDKKESKQFNPEESKVDFNFFKFLNYFPSPVTSLAYHKHSDLIAVSRDDSCIEIWLSSTWSQRLRIQLSPQEKVVSLVWLKLKSPCLLLACCINGSLKLFDPHSSTTPIADYQSAGGYIWDVKMQKNTNIFLMAFDDGFTRLFQIYHSYKQNKSKLTNNQNNIEYELDDEEDAQDNQDLFSLNNKKGSIKFVSSTRNFEERCFGVTWDFSESSEFYASYESGTIRKFNNQNQVILTMTVHDQKGKNFAWKIEHTQTNYLIAGCSDGQVCIFETKFGTINKIFKQHQADILAILYNPLHEVIYISGSDSKIVCFQFTVLNESRNITQEANIVNTQNNLKNNGEWIVASEDRGQSHDIRVLHMLNEQTLISAGITTDLCIYTLNQNGLLISQHSSYLQKSDKKDPRRKRNILGLTQITNQISISEQKNLILYRKPCQLELWEFDRGTHNYQLNFSLNSKLSIISSDLHRSGQYMAYSNQSELIIFKIFDNLNLKRTHLIENPAQLLLFSRKSQKLFYLTQDNKLCYLKLNQDKPVILNNNIDPLLKNAQHYCFGEHEHSIIIGSKLNNKIIQYSIIDTNDQSECQDKHPLVNQGKILFEIPKLFDDVSFTTFKLVKQTNQLLVVYENKKIALYDLNEKTISRWTRENIKRMPLNYLNKYGHIIGVVQHPNIMQQFILYSNYYFVIVNIRQHPPKLATNEDILQNEECRKERISNFTIIELKNPLFSIKEDIQKNFRSLFAFETDFSEMLKHLPEPVIAKKMII